MKKRLTSLLLALCMVLSAAPAVSLPAAAAGETDSKNVSNTSTDTFETLNFNTDTGELTSDVRSGKSPTGPGSFAIRTISELLLSGKGWSSGDIAEWNSSLKNNLGYGLYDYDSSAVNFSSKDSSGYMHNLRKRTATSAYTGTGGLPASYDFVKALAFDPTGSGKDDFVAYLYAKYTWTPTESTFTLYVANKDGVVSSVYNLGTAPFILRTHQADAYMPLAAGDYDGDGRDELAVYCFGDSTKTAQWGSATDTTKPYYKTDTAGNPVDKNNKRINADGYLIDAATGLRIDAAGKLIAADGYLIDGTTGLRIDANGHLINAEGKLVATTDGGASYTYIDADGNDVADQNDPSQHVTGTPVPGVPVPGTPVGYKTAPVDDENLDVRVLDVGVTTDAATKAVTGIALSRAARGAAGGGSINVEYDLTNLGFSKADVVTVGSGTGEVLANMKSYPIVDLSTIQQPGDEYDDLVLCVSRANFSVPTAAEAATRMVFWVDPGSSTGARTQTMSGVWYHRADYGNSASAAYSAEMMAFGGASEANLDGDADGYNEVVVAGYRYANTNTTVRLSSLTATPSGDDNPFKMDDADSDNINYYLAATYSYDAATRSYVSDGPAAWIFVDDGEYNDSTNLREEIYDGNTERDVVFAPLEVLGFAEKGAGYADSVFINSFICDYYLNNGSVSTLPYGPWDDLKNSAFSKRGGKFLFVSYAIPTSYILVENDPSRDGKATTHQRWIGDAVAGNFDGDASGVEELYCTYMRNRNDDGFDLTSATLLAVQKKKPGTLSNTSDLYGSDLKINDDSSIYDEHDTVGSANYSFSGNDLWQEQEGRSFALSAPDWDNDSVIARASSTLTPEYYFSDPNVIAVLQSAPYFEELSADYDFYPSNGSTSIEKETGTTNSGSAGFEVSAGLIIGMKAEIKPFGIPIGETEVKNTVTASLSTEYSHETTQRYSTAFTAMVGTDMVALTMTPYVRYYYDVYDPETKEWAVGEMTVDMPKTPRTSMVSVETYDRVAQYSGWESIRGNILSSTPGDPYSYATTPSGLSSFEGGRTTMGSSGNNWVGVGTGGTGSVGNITQTISSETTNAFSVTVGLNFEYEATATVFGATAGFTASAGVTAGYGHATFTGMSFSGTVDNLPQDAAAGYDFLWRFGCWKDSLSYTTSSGKTDSNSVYVLGYLVKDVESLPKPPQDLAVVNFTENSITLEWSHPDPMPVSYIVYREESGGLVPLQIVRADASGGKTAQQYVDTTCEPGTEYTYVVASVRYVNGFETKGPNSPKAKGKTLSSGVPKIIIKPLRPVAASGDDVTLTAEVTGVDGGGAPSIQWQKWNGSNYVNINGESGDAYTMRNVTDELNGSRYRCYVTQMVNGRWMVGYSVYSELTVTKRASATALDAVEPAAYAVNTPVSLGASVKDGETPVTDGSVVISVVNTSTGSVWNIKGALNGSGAVTGSFTPAAAGVYTVSARYLGTKVYAGSESTTRSFTAYSVSGKVLMIESGSEMTYGDKLPLSAALVGNDGTGATAAAAYKVTDGTTFDSQTTSVDISGGTFDPIAASNALYQTRNGQTCGYNDACGNYVIQASYMDPDDGVTYYATKLVTVKPRTLTVTIPDKTIKIGAIDAGYLSGVTPAYDFAGYADSMAASYEALFELYTDKPYGELYVGDHAVRLRYRDKTASGLGDSYEPTMAQLLANYNVRYADGVLHVTGDWYTVSYSVGSGEGSLDARTASRASLASSTYVLKGTPLTFAAAPAVGYAVSGWTATDNISSLQSASTQSGTVTKNTNVTVSFDVKRVSLGWSKNGSGSVSAAMGAAKLNGVRADVPATGTFTFTAVPDAGSMISEWKVNGVAQSGTAKTLTLSGLSGDTTVQASFTSERYYTVTAAGTDGAGSARGSVAVSPAPNAQGKLIAGSTVRLTAAPPEGMLVSQWRSCAADGSYTVLQYNVDDYTVQNLQEDLDIRVVFVPMVKYRVTTAVVGAGGVLDAENTATKAAIASGSSQYAGIPVSFTATPISGYAVKSVKLTTSAGTTALTPAAGNLYALSALSEDVTVTAEFAAAHTITASAGANGTISPSGAVTVADGADRTFTVTPNSGYAVDTLLADGKAAALTGGGYTFASVTANHTISVTFKTAGGGGGGGSEEVKQTDSGVKYLNTTDHIAYLAGYVNGSFGPDRDMTRAEAAMMFYRLLLDRTAGETKTFTDVDAGAWYGAAVGKLAGLGIITGYDDGAFRPDHPITRAEFVAMATRFTTLADAGRSFSDVSTSHWAYKYIAFASAQGWISGYPDGTFGPGKSVTRAEVTKIVNRMLGRAADTAYVSAHSVRTFPDVSKNDWAFYEIAEASNAHSYTKNAAGAETWTGLK